MRIFTVLLVLLLVACSGVPDERHELAAHIEGMNLVVVVLDAATAGHFPMYGYERDTTPRLAELAAESVLFETAWAQASATPLSVLSLFTSRYPFLDHLPEIRGEIGPILPAQVPHLPGLLAPAFHTRIGMSTNSWISGAFGYAQAFDRFHELFDDDGGSMQAASAARLTTTFLEWLPRGNAGSFFAYLHYFEPHAPYTPPAVHEKAFLARASARRSGTHEALKPWRKRIPEEATREEIIALYDANLRYVDTEVGRMLDGLRRDSSYERTVIVVLADHGEAFWEHGVRGHGLHAYEEMIRVPLMIRVPDVAPGRVETPVELIDILPTLLELFDQPSPPLFGRSLAGALVGDSLEPRPLLSRNHERSDPHLAWREGNRKMIQAIKGGLELYDLSADPLERVNLYEGPGSPTQMEMREMSIRLNEVHSLTKEAWSAAVVAPDSLDPALEERLRAMGYLH